MSNNNTILKISRSKYIEESLGVALLRLDSIQHYKGTPVMINYYTDDSQSSFDTVFASGIKDGVGRDCYRLISVRQDDIVWGASNILPDVSNLVNGERYLYQDPSGTWSLVKIASDGRTREVLDLPEYPLSYECISDNSKWVIGEDKKLRRVNDIYSQSEIDALFDTAINTVKYVDFENLTPTQIEILRGDKGNDGIRGEVGPIGLQGPQGLTGRNGSVDNFVIMSEEEYQALLYKDPNKFYFTYENDEQPGGGGSDESDFICYVDNTTLVIDGSIISNSILSIDPAYATYISDSSYLILVGTAASAFAPVFNPTPGTYDGVKTIQITSTTQDAEIRYTIDGTEPTSASFLYTTPLTLDQSSTIKARTYKLGLTGSKVTEARYDLVFNDTVPNPIISPVSGTYKDSVFVQIISQDSDTLIRYTLDGTVPNETSNIYIAPIEVYDSMTSVRARGYKSCHNPSDVVTEIYRLQDQESVRTPTFNIQSGVYTETQYVTIRTETTGAVIRYTLDGTIPNRDSRIYTEPIIVSSLGTTVIKASAHSTGLISSNIVELSVTIQEPEPEPPITTDDIEIQNNTVIDNTANNSVYGSIWIVTNAAVENNKLIFN